MRALGVATIALSFVVAAVALLAGCTLSDAMPGLREGMSPTEVKAIMGSPTGQARQGEMLGMGWTNRMISGWAWDRTDAYAIFEDDKLISWGTGEVRQGGPDIQHQQLFIWPMP